MKSNRILAALCIAEMDAQTNGAKIEFLARLLDANPGLAVAFAERFDRSKFETLRTWRELE